MKTKVKESRTIEVSNVIVEKCIRKLTEIPKKHIPEAGDRAHLTMEVSNLLVKKCMRELAGLPEKYMPEAHTRANVAWSKGRKKAKIDVVKTEGNIKRFLRRFSIPCLMYTVETGLFCRTIAVIDQKMVMMVGFIPFTEEYRQEIYKFDLIVTNIAISKHALARWMYRNQRTDYMEGLEILGMSMIMEDMNLGVMAISDGKVAVGQFERQVVCSDGGISIVSIEDASEEHYPSMNWTLVTYLDPSLIQEWNNAAVDSQYDNLQERVGELF